MKSPRIFYVFLVWLLFFTMPACAQRDALTDDISDEWDAIFQIIDKYSYQNVDHRLCYEQTQRGGISACLDQYSEYLTKSDFHNLQDEMSGRYAGIGAQVYYYEDKIILVPFIASPALITGIRPNDILLKVDSLDVTFSREVTKTDVDSVVRLIRGDPGTSVQLTVQRGDSVFSVVVVRQRVEVSSVLYTMIGRDIGYVRVLQFGEDTDGDFKKALRELENQGMRNRVIVDLRNNPGGYVPTVLNMLELFSPAPRSLAITEKYKMRTRYEFTDSFGEFTDYTVVILVNEFTASASEIFSGTLQEWNRAIVVGTQTFGKGIGQGIYPLSRNPLSRLSRIYLKLTIFRYLVGNSQRDIHEIGVTPDIVVENILSDEQQDQFRREKWSLLADELYINPDLDAPLKKALELLN